MKKHTYESVTRVTDYGIFLNEACNSNGKPAWTASTKAWLQNHPTPDIYHPIPSNKSIIYFLFLCLPINPSWIIIVVIPGPPPSAFKPLPQQILELLRKGGNPNDGFTKSWKLSCVQTNKFKSESKTKHWIRWNDAIISLTQYPHPNKRSTTSTPEPLPCWRHLWSPQLHSLSNH